MRQHHRPFSDRTYAHNDVMLPASKPVHSTAIGPLEQTGRQPMALRI